MSSITSQPQVMITGASDGIGLETARQYVTEGARVLLVSRGIQKLRAAAGSLGESVEVAAVDLTDRAAIESFLRSLDARGYTPDVLVNNAGQGLSGAFVESDWSPIASMLELNMVALARLTHWAAGRMKAVGRGAIVNVSAAVATRPVPWFAAYAASKAFVTNLSQALDYELSALRRRRLGDPSARRAHELCRRRKSGSALDRRPEAVPDRRSSHGGSCGARRRPAPPTLRDHWARRRDRHGHRTDHAASARSAVHVDVVQGTRSCAPERSAAPLNVSSILIDG
jgi:NADP-dependent 3-hydroxy acid dehydrogenase YdfG